MLYLFLGLIVLAGVLLLYQVLKKGSRLQRRLFLLFFVLAFMPSLATLFITWTASERQIGVLESPGLESSIESSLALARHVVGKIKSESLRAADSLAAIVDPDSTAPITAENRLLRLSRSSGELVWSTHPLPEVPPPDSRSSGNADRIRVEGRSFVVATAEVSRSGEDFILEVFQPLDPELAVHLDRVGQGFTRYRQLRLFYGKLLRGDTVLTLSVLMFLILTISYFLSRHFSRQVARPIAEIALGTERVAGGDLDHVVDIRAIDEIQGLADSFNRMTEQLEQSRASLVRSERIAAWQGVARRLAHEIKNPLTPIHLAIHRIRKKMDDPMVEECLDTMLEETANLRRLADEFALYARMPEPRKQPFALRELLEPVVELYGSGRIEVAWLGWETTIRVNADEGLVRRVFSNLFKNAVEAMEGSGTITLRAEATGGMVDVYVEDQGPGLPETEEILFTPDFSTKVQGTGLGLPICKKIVEDHGGSMRAFSKEGGGAVFVVRLPEASSGERGAPSESIGESASSGGGGRKRPGDDSEEMH